MNLKKVFIKKLLCAAKVGGSLAANFANVGNVHMWNCGSSSTYNGSTALITDSSQYIWYYNLLSIDEQRYLGIPGTIGSTGDFIFIWQNYN